MAKKSMLRSIKDCGLFFIKAVAGNLVLKKLSYRELNCPANAGIKLFALNF